MKGVWLVEYRPNGARAWLIDAQSGMFGNGRDARSRAARWSQLDRASEYRARKYVPAPERTKGKR